MMDLIDVVGKIRKSERQKLEEIGIMTPGQLQLANAEKVAEATGFDAETVTDWQTAVGEHTTTVQVDDLTKVKGIGRKRADELADYGIVSFVQFLHVDTAKLAELINTTEAQVEAWKAAARLRTEVASVKGKSVDVRVRTTTATVTRGPVEHLSTRKRPYGGEL